MHEILLTVQPHGSVSYGFSVSETDREQYFDTEQIVTIGLPANTESIIVEKGFNKCGELIEIRIKNWLIKNRYIPYKRNFPPKFWAEIVKQNYIRITKDSAGRAFRK